MNEMSKLKMKLGKTEDKVKGLVDEIMQVLGRMYFAYKCADDDGEREEIWNSYRCLTDMVCEKPSVLIEKLESVDDYGVKMLVDEFDGKVSGVKYE